MKTLNTQTSEENHSIKIVNKLKTIFKPLIQSTKTESLTPIVFILIISATLCLYQLGKESLWIDEIYSVRDVKTGRGFPPDNLNRPLYYILLNVWMQFSHNDAWLRGLSVIFGLGCVLLTYLIVRRLIDNSTGLIASSLLSISPLFINHAQEVRMYSLSTFLGLAGTLSMVYILDKPTHSRFAWWSTLRFLAIITVPLNVTLLVPDIVLAYATFRNQKKVLLDFGKWALLVFILWTPCVLLSVAPQTAQFSTLGTQQARSAPKLIDFIRITRAFSVWPDKIIPDSFISYLTKVASLVLVLLIGVSLSWKNKLKKISYIAAWGFLPLIQIFIFSNLFFSIWLDRYLLFTAPYLLMLLAVGFMRIWQNGRMFALALALVYGTAAGSGLAHYYSTQTHTDFRGIIGVIRTNEQPEDKIIWAIDSWISTVPLIHYDHGAGEVIVKDKVPSNEGIDLVDDIENWIDSLPALDSRLWLVCKLDSKNDQIFVESIQEKFEIHLHNKFRDEGIYPYHVLLVEPLKKS